VTIPPAWAGLEDDYRLRTDPELLTTLLADAVPVLRFLDFTVTETRPGFCQCKLPLSTASSNQHGVHQAAVLGIAADYAGGIALGSLCHGAPIIGVHPQFDDDGASLWAVSLTLDYKLPSSSDVILNATVPTEEHEKIQRRYQSGKMVLAKVPVTLTGDGELFAEAEITYFIRRARSLRPSSPTAKPNAMFVHKSKASARLIAALRGIENHHPEPLYLDPHASTAAGPHGQLLAERFLEKSPQLAGMVAARTFAVDALIRTGRFEQLVLIGAGYDLRPLRLHADEADAPVCFEIDLPEMLSSREQLIDKLGSAHLPRIQVPLNLELQGIASALIEKGFRPEKPTLFVFEGTSMYLRDETNQKVFADVRALATEKSRLWVDYVTEDVIRGEVRIPEVLDFLDGIKRLGEPFIWGLRDPHIYFAALGWTVEADTSSDYVRPSGDPVFDIYRFLTLRPRFADFVDHHSGSPDV